jgi:HNH endonuclease
MFMDVATFWKRIQKVENGCWLWTGSKSTGRCGGYGNLKFNGKTISAHRLAYILTYGEIPDQQEVCHSCDDRLCCNPAHLFVGTHLENMRDMFKKGRNKGWTRRYEKASDSADGNTIGVQS